MDCFKILTVNKKSGDSYKRSYEVYNENQPSFSRTFESRTDAYVYADAANTGRTDEQCMELVRKAQNKRRKQSENRKARDEAMRSIGMRKVKGNLGGAYWE